MSTTQPNATAAPTSEPHEQLRSLAELRQLSEQITARLGQVIVGQRSTIEQLLIGLASGGHCLLIGVPGLAKTLMISSLAKTLGLQISRIQFTPDLMPADITGTDVIQEDKLTGERRFRFVPGPIFANLVLADELNRAPPKTQAALLEAMQERQVTAAGQRHPLPHPFFVLATQNPIEQEGTYNLPEAQLDRFMLSILVDYPSPDEELSMVMQTTGQPPESLEAVIDGAQLEAWLGLVRRLPVAESIARYGLQLARMTRPQSEEAPAVVQQNVRWGAGPRASQALVLAAKARAALRGDPLVSIDDIQHVAKPVLRHRLRLNFQAHSRGLTADQLIDQLLPLAASHVSSENRRAPLDQLFRS
jgi:MoxR-like ATPase